MKDKNALFLLQAIGELSEQTVAEAKRPVVFRFRYIAAAVAAVMVAAVLVTATVMMNAPDEPEQTVNVDNKSITYQDKPATPDQVGEIATRPTEAPTEAVEYEENDYPDSEDLYDDGTAAEEYVPHMDLDALYDNTWERDQESISKWYAEHPGFKSTDLLDGVTGKNRNTSPTLPVIVWDPNY